MSGCGMEPAGAPDDEAQPARSKTPKRLERNLVIHLVALEGRRGIAGAHALA